MRSLVFISVLFRISFVFGEDVAQAEKKSLSAATSESDFNELAEELKAAEFRSFLDEMVDWSSSAREYIRERSMMQNATLPPVEDVPQFEYGSHMTFHYTAHYGRRIKHKKSELRFIMKTLLISKLIMGFFLPLGIIASKILSWKAVTLSLMAFMLAKILFVKNLLTSKTAFSLTPANYVPPVFIHGGPNDVFWKRQGEAQTMYPWGSTQ